MRSTASPPNASKVYAVGLFGELALSYMSQAYAVLSDALILHVCMSASGGPRQNSTQLGSLDLG